MIAFYINKKYKKDFEILKTFIEREVKIKKSFDVDLGDVSIILANRFKNYCHAEGDGILISTGENNHWDFKNYWAVKMHGEITNLLQELGYEIDNESWEDWYYR